MTGTTDKVHRTVVLDGERLERERESCGLAIGQVPDFIVEKVTGYDGRVSESTYRRAEGGRAVFVKTARVIAAAFDIPFEELVVRSDLQPPLDDVDRFLPEVRLIIRTWLNEGYDGMDAKLPAHPEFLYRLSGDWKGWNEFLGVTPEKPEWKENRMKDIHEDCAFFVVEALVALERLKTLEESVPPASADELPSQAPRAPQPGRPSYARDDLVRVDGEQVKRLRKERGRTQAKVVQEMNSAGVGWLRKIEAGKMVRLEWNSDTRVVRAGEDLAEVLGVELDTLILDLLDGEQIEQFRAQRNWGPEQLAEHAHVDLGVVGRAETGQYVRRVEARAFAKALNVPLVKLLFKEQARRLN